jgi:hypothetical protein
MGSPTQFGIFERNLNYRAWPVWLGLAVVVTFSAAAAAQDTSSSKLAAIPDRQLLLQMQDELRQTRAELARAQARIEQLNRRVELLGGYMGVSHESAGHAGGGAQYGLGTPADSGQLRSDATERTEIETGDAEMLRAQVEEQSQTKLESASKYRVKVSGLILMNAFSNGGGVNQIDVPSFAQHEENNSSVGATLRQSVVGLEVFGPTLAGAHTSGRVSIDFYGGFPVRSFAITAGVIRLREASARLDWRDTSLTVGQEAPFISPLSPTSYASLAEPAMSWSGNLWTWTPQVVAEHRFHTSERSYVAVSGGLMAPLSESVLLPPDAAEAAAYASSPGPGERTRRPAFASSIGWHSQAFGQPLQFGIGGYSSRQHYEFNRATKTWAVTAWWQVPLTSRFELSGEAYRGLAVGGLGGGIWQSAFFGGDPEDPATAFRGLNAAGGWAQLKFRPHSRWETNVAIGQDNVLARDLRWAPILEGEFTAPMARNRTAFSNVIFRPRSNLVLSAEYRKIWTYGYIGPAALASQVNLGAGISF